MSQMKNQVIEVLTREHGEKVMEYWQSQGVDACSVSWILSKAGRDSHRYYGVIEGKFSSYSLYEVEAAGAEIIELPDVSRPVPEEIHEALARIEAKLDKLLRENNSDKVVKFTSGGIVVQEKAQLAPFTVRGESIQRMLSAFQNKMDDDEEGEPVEFKPGDRVRVKTWKEIKKLTKKDWYKRRLFDDGNIFTPDDRLVCGAEGVVEPHTNRPYIAINVNGVLYAIAPQALEKL